ncbi:MAG TPA: hypothetical protein VFL88_00510, partial [Gemmatimonadales bacterium]|nr:hypothetical protein [Gemmatimonadales bacterium]
MPVVAALLDDRAALVSLRRALPRGGGCGTLRRHARTVAGLSMPVVAALLDDRAALVSLRRALPRGGPRVVA